jgi:uncharacterized protein YkwD
VPAPRKLVLTALSIVSCAALTAGSAAASQAPATVQAYAAAHAKAACAKKSSAHAARRDGARACRSSSRKSLEQKAAKARPVRTRAVTPKPVRPHRERNHTTNANTPPAASEPSAASVQASDAARESATIAAVLATSCQNTELTPEPDNIGLVRGAVLCLINRKRAENGEAPLKTNPDLEEAAEGHCEELIADDYFAHVSPSGETPVDRIRDTGYIPSPSDGYVIGENLAWGTYQLSTPAAIVAAWIASPGHLANIHETQYTETGIGITPAVPSSLAAGAPGATYAQEFGVIIQ